MKSKFLHTGLLVLTILLFSSLMVRSAAGPRGTDQYWYIAEVESIALHHSVSTNAVYPNSLKWEPLRLPPPPIHNILPIYVVALVATLTGGYKAWLSVNFLCALLSASLTSVLVYRVAESTGSAVLAFSMFLLMPLTVWQSSQPLAEMVTAVPVIAATLVYVCFRGFKSIVGALIFCGIAYLSRESFVVPLLTLPLLYLLALRPFSRVVLTRSLVLLAISGVFIFVHFNFMPQNIPECPAAVRLLTASPGTDNMTCLYDSEPLRFPALQILSKMWRSVSSQVVGIDYSHLIFYLPFDLLAIPSAVLIFNARSGLRRVGIASLVVLSTHLATILVNQNEFRYMELSVPIVVAGTVVWLTSIQVSRVLPWVFLTSAFVCLTMPINFAAVAKIRHDAAQDRLLSTSLRQYFSSVPQYENIMFDARKAPGMSAYVGQIVPYIASPRLVLSIDSSVPCAQIELLRKTVRATWLFSSSRSPLLQLFSSPDAVPPRGPISSPLAEWRLYHIGRASCSVPGQQSLLRKGSELQ